MKRTIPAKFCGRAFSTVSSTTTISSITRQLERKKSLFLWAAFFGGYITHAYQNYRECSEYWGKVNRMYDDHEKRKEELNQRFSRVVEREREAGRLH